MKKYPDEFITMMDNMIRLHFCYEDMYAQIKVCFPNLHISYNKMLDIVSERIITMI